MKAISNSTVILFTSVCLLSCQDNKSKDKEHRITNDPINNAIIYEFKSDPDLTWTAYKFTDKVGVNGTFEQITVSNPVQKGTIENLLQNMSFRIATNSVNTNMELRDQRIYNSFFKIIEADTISGELIEVKNGNGKMSLSIGDIININEFNYSVINDTLSIGSSIDLVNWNAQKGIDSLNQVCKIEHTGADGLSKLWPTVDIAINMPLTKNN